MAMAISDSRAVPDPVMIHPADALVRVTTSSICSTDIHIKHHGNEMKVNRGRFSVMNLSV